MLLELHVKNLALIERADVEFESGLNIMTGETGAGKSIIIGSVNLALGQKVPKDIIRKGAEYAYVELIFTVEEATRSKLESCDVLPDENGLIIITRKIMPNRSISKINDETVTVGKLRQVTGLLIDIHGQHEHQSLLHASRHLEILDAYAKNEVQGLKEEVASVYKEYRELDAEWKSGDEDGDSRRREADFLRFEIEEIENAAIRDGEEEELTEIYRRYVNGRKIMESLSAAYDAADVDGLGRAIHQMGEVTSYDTKLEAIEEQLYDAEAILNDVRHAMREYLDDMSYDEEELAQIEARLDLIHNLQAKYGTTAAKIERSLEEKRQRLEQLDNYDEYRQQLKLRLEKTTSELEKLSKQLSQIRKKQAEPLTERIREGLIDLNFLDVAFSMEFKKMDHYSANGYDEAEFVISTNPGEPLRPLGNVASGGELSRIMLAIKTILADTDEIETLIFDEIDTGISGRTAQKVSEKLAIISENHQVICITHLPQIAAMADSHFEITKSTSDGKTTTRIHALDQERMTEELARLLGGAEITDAVKKNAYEMKILADTTKCAVRKQTV